MLITPRDGIFDLKECLVTEITVTNERCFTYSYRSPSQNCEQFQSFCDSPDILMNNINGLNPAISIITGDINKKCSKWCSFDTSDHIGIELGTINQLWVIVKLLTNQPILKTFHLLALTLFLHLILA